MLRAGEVVEIGHEEKEAEGDVLRHRLRESRPGNSFPWETPAQCQPQHLRFLNVFIISLSKE